MDVQPDGGRAHLMRDGAPMRQLRLTPEALRYLGRRCLMVAAALDGVPAPPGPSGPHVEPYRGVWPRRMPIESGIPPELVADSELHTSPRLLYVALWLSVPWMLRRPVASARASEVCKLMGLKDPMGAQRNMLRLEARGWCDRRVPRAGDDPLSWDILLHQQRQERPGRGWMDEAEAKIRRASTTNTALQDNQSEGQHEQKRPKVTTGPTKPNGSASE